MNWTVNHITKICENQEMLCCFYAKLKGNDDEVVLISPVQFTDLMLISENGYALRFNLDDVPVLGARAAGVKAIDFHLQMHQQFEHKLLFHQMKN